MNSTDDDEDSSQPKKKGNITDEKLWITTMVLSYILTSISITIINPYFPKYVVDRGISNTWSGLIIASIWLPQVILFPVLCNYVMSTGIKSVFILGNFILGITTVIFAFMSQVETKFIFILICVLIKIFQGIGVSFIKASAVCYISKHMTDSCPNTLGFLETGSAVGAIIGPAIGGVIYDKTGFQVPNFAVGGALLILFIVDIILVGKLDLPLDESEKPDEESRRDIKKQHSAILKISDTYVIAASCFFSFFIPYYYDIYFPMYAAEMSGLRPTTIGVIMLLFAAPDSISSLITGCIVLKLQSSRRVMFAGALITACLLFALSIVAAFRLINYFVLAAMIIAQAAFTNLMLIPAFAVTKEIATANGIDNTEGLDVAISNVIVMSATVGQMVGNGLSGIIFETIGTGYGSLVFFILLAFLMIFELRIMRPQDETNETTSLL